MNESYFRSVKLLKRENRDWQVKVFKRKDYKGRSLEEDFRNLDVDGMEFEVKDLDDKHICLTEMYFATYRSLKFLDTPDVDFTPLNDEGDDD